MTTDVTDLFDARRLTLIAGPCVIESFEMCRDLAAKVAEMAARHNVGYIFKASFDKANRTSLTSFRGPGLERGLEILAKVKEEVGVPVLTDIHQPAQAARAAEVVDVLQIPAFLCRQTDLLVAAAKTGLPTNIKKGQFLAPEDMRHAVAKHQDSGGGPVSVTERGSSFGYHNLVVDMRSLVLVRRATGAPIIFDATHSIQRPGSGDGTTGGDREFAPLLARAAAAVGVDGLFCEVHPNPDEALSDGPNSLTLDMLEHMLSEVVAIDAARKQTR
ncbi:MAG: 3-deoxy-8-phosphooctulonate synthase [Deltaproteobacteria bacterium RIFOXYA12_FULL_58_15]|nr:MAG: 3-deoxy-8-phosphooctulonate synthase [Deltaproteobacteria bacterium RIFOXYA12_FULL_58_15]OGR14307.1 MAG: 3-deoxy-8-phosphooctulonate synthase [Deltaproteobacteria bacterium RIFOXYB12_FULL_58_9]